MALKSLSEIRNLNDPLKQFQVTFTISDLPALKLAIAQQKVTGILSGNGDTVSPKTLELRCTSFSYPGTKLGQSTTTIGGFRRKLATIQNKSGEWTCNITEDQNGGVLNTIQAWCDLIHNPFNGVRAPSSVYVSTCVVRIETATSNHDDYGKSGRTLWLKGFYPIKYSVGEINASDSQPVSINVTFNYDWWSETPTSLSALGV